MIFLTYFILLFNVGIYITITITITIYITILRSNSNKSSQLFQTMDLSISLNIICDLFCAGASSVSLRWRGQPGLLSSYIMYLKRTFKILNIKALAKCIYKLSANISEIVTFIHWLVAIIVIVCVYTGPHLCIL